MLNPSGETLCDPPAPWALRSVPERDIVEHLLIWHFPAPRVTDEFAAARATIAEALRRWCSIGLAFAEDARGGRYFDPVEVSNFSIAAGLRGADDYWRRHLVPAAGDLIFSHHGLRYARDHVPASRDLPPRRYRVALRRDFDLSGFAAGGKVRLRLPIPIADHALDLLSIAFSAPVDARRHVAEDRFEARLTLEQPGLVSLGFEASFIVRPDLGHDEALSEADVALYTAPRENLIMVSPRILELAGRLRQGEPTNRAIVLRFFDYINDSFILGNVPYHALDSQYPTDWPINHGGFDCQLGATLLCALCRAASIPARLVSGYQLYRTNLAYHYWSQIWIDGRWLPFDFSSWNLMRALPGDDWRPAFAGQVDYRLKVQVMPKRFTGASSLKLPRQWHNLVRRTTNGLTNNFVDATDNGLVYRDDLEILSIG